MKKNQENEEKSFLDYMLEDMREKENPILRWISIYFWHRPTTMIGDFFRGIKWSLQRFFRSHHSSDRDIWDLHSHLAPILLGKLKAFRASPLHGYPSCFSDWDEKYGCGPYDKEEYDKAVEEGHILGGGFEAWLKTLDKMIFAFDFLTYYEHWDEKKRDAMLARHGLEYPHQKKPENRKINYAYKGKDGHFMSSHLPPDDPDNKNRTFLGEEISYYNFDLEREYYEKVQEGLSLFAKHFMSLWD